MRYVVSVKATCKRRIGKAKGIAVCIVVLVRQRVTIIQIRLVYIVKHHVHATDAEHGSVRIRTVKYLFAETVSLSYIKQIITLMLCDKFGCFHNKTRRTHCRVADGIIKSGSHQFHHHADDMARGAELSVCTRCCHDAEHILIHITHHVSPIGRDIFNTFDDTR